MFNSHLKAAIGAATLATLCLPVHAQDAQTQDVQPQDPVVKVYGQLGLGLTTQSGVSSTTAKTTLGDAIISSSSFGLRGREDLGGGLTGIYRLEAGITPDTGVAGGTIGGTNRFFNKQSYVGLGFNNAGVLTIGRQYHAAVDRVTRTTDPQQAAGGLAVLPIGLFGINRFYSNDSRVDSSVKYKLTGPAGLEGSASYGLGNDVSGNSYSAEIAQLTPTYRIALYMVNYAAPAVVAGVGNRPEHEVWGTGVNFPVGPVRLYVNYLTSKLDATVAGRGTQTNQVTTLGAVWNAAPYTYRVIYTYDQGTKLNGVTGRDGVKDTLVTSATYDWSKSTSFFGVLYANRFSDGYMLETVNIAALGRDPTSPTVSGVSVGVIHKF